MNLKQFTLKVGAPNRTRTMWVDLDKVAVAALESPTECRIYFYSGWNVLVVANDFDDILDNDNYYIGESTETNSPHSLIAFNPTRVDAYNDASHQDIYVCVAQHCFILSLPEEQRVELRKFSGNNLTRF